MSALFFQTRPLAKYLCNLSNFLGIPVKFLREEEGGGGPKGSLCIKARHDVDNM